MRRFRGEWGGCDLWLYQSVNRDLGLSAHSTLLVAPRAILARNRGGTEYLH